MQIGVREFVNQYSDVLDIRVPRIEGNRVQFRIEASFRRTKLA